jgi:hypothetical protein
MAGSINVDNFIELLCMTQEEVEVYVGRLVPNSKRVSGEYIYVDNGKDKPILTAHMDTINDHRGYRLTKEDLTIGKALKVSLKDTSGAVCLGGDDRTGVYIMLKLIEMGNTNYSYLFTCDEEVGGHGGESFVKHYPDITPKCIISLDRKGTDEVALYGYDNDELVNVFENEGYTRDVGSFTDCVTLSDKYNVACVNLSSGYTNEHTTKEQVQFKQTMRTLKVLNTVSFSKVYECVDSIDKYRMYDGVSDWDTLGGYDVIDYITFDDLSSEKQRELIQRGDDLGYSMDEVMEMYAEVVV